MSQYASYWGNVFGSKTNSHLRHERQHRAKVHAGLVEAFGESRSIATTVASERLADTVAQLSPAKRDRFSRLMTDLDTNGDGRVSFDEIFTALVTHRCELTYRQLLVLQLLTFAVPTGHVGNDGATTDEHIPDSYVDAYTCVPPPLFMPAMCVAELAVFAVYAVECNRRGDDTNFVTATTGVAYWSPLIFDPAKRRVELWRFVSYALLHQGYQHVVFNVVMQLLFGVPMEMVHKGHRVATVFLTGVVAGALSSALFDQHTLLAGASGGVYALIGAHYANVIMNWEELQRGWMKRWLGRWRRATPEPTTPSILTADSAGLDASAAVAEDAFHFMLSGIMRLIVLPLLIAGDVGTAVYRRYYLHAESSTSYAAHVGGLVNGVLVGILVLRNLHKENWEKWLARIVFGIYITMLMAAVAWNVLYHGPAPENTTVS